MAIVFIAPFNIIDLPIQSSRAVVLELGEDSKFLPESYESYRSPHQGRTLLFFFVPKATVISHPSFRAVLPWPPPSHHPQSHHENNLPKISHNSCCVSVPCYLTCSKPNFLFNSFKIAIIIKQCVAKW